MEEKALVIEWDEVAQRYIITSLIKRDDTPVVLADHTVVATPISWTEVLGELDKPQNDVDKWFLPSATGVRPPVEGV